VEKQNYLKELGVPYGLPSLKFLSDNSEFEYIYESEMMEIGNYAVRRPPFVQA